MFPLDDVIMVPKQKQFATKLERWSSSAGSSFPIYSIYSHRLGRSLDMQIVCTVFMWLMPRPNLRIPFTFRLTSLTTRWNKLSRLVAEWLCGITVNCINVLDKSPASHSHKTLPHAIVSSFPQRVFVYYEINALNLMKWNQPPGMPKSLDNRGQRKWHWKSRYQ